MNDGFGAKTVTAAIESSDGPAICAFVTAGYPTPELFADVLVSVAGVADVLEIGVPFTDPMADGLTIQEASRVALQQGATLDWLFELLGRMEGRLEAPHLLMGYYNPFLAHGLDALAEAMVSAGTSGLIVPDLPLEESGPLLGVLDPVGLALIQLVTPTTSSQRLKRIAAAASGFLYAVTTTGVTGGMSGLAPGTLQYLDRVKSASPVPVLAGFGVRTADQAALLGEHVDGVIVGSALIESLDRAEDPAVFLGGLRM